MNSAVIYIDMSIWSQISAENSALVVATDNSSALSASAYALTVIKQMYFNLHRHIDQMISITL